MSHHVLISLPLNLAHLHSEAVLLACQKNVIRLKDAFGIVFCKDLQRLKLIPQNYHSHARLSKLHGCNASNAMEVRRA